MGIYRELRQQGEAESSDFVLVERAEGAAVVTLNEPDRLNVLSAALCVQLKAALEELVADPNVRVVTLTGAGRGFSAGGDFKMMRFAEDRLSDPPGSTDVWRWIRSEFGGIARLIARSDTAFIAALNGPAAGVGLAWVLSCDLVIASEDAVIVPAFGRIGLLPEVGTSWALTRLLGYQGAFAFFAAGKHLTAQEAATMGLVQQVVPHDDLLATAGEWAKQLLELPEHAIAMSKPLLRAASDASWDHALTMEEFAEPNCFTTASFQAAVRGSPPTT